MGSVATPPKGWLTRTHVLPWLSLIHTYTKKDMIRINGNLNISNGTITYQTDLHMPCGTCIGNWIKYEYMRGWSSTLLPVIMLYMCITFCRWATSRWPCREVQQRWANTESIVWRPGARYKLIWSRAFAYGRIFSGQINWFFIVWFVWWA